MASNEIEVLEAAQTAGTDAENAPGREVNRRRFLTALGITGAVAGAGMIAGCSTGSTTTSTGTSSTSSTQPQVDALNFALNLKYLSATFYSYITKGTDLPGSQTTGSGAVTGTPGQLTFTAAHVTNMLGEITYDEVNHVTALRNALGSAAVARPTLNLAAFGAITAANALSIARAFEDLNVTAFASVATLLSSSSVTLTTQVLGADSYHAGALRLVSLQNAVPFLKMDSLDVPVYDPNSATTAAAGPSANGGFFATAGAGTSSASYPAGMAFYRTASQALAILYGSAAGTVASSGAKSGGFFPNGVTGNIVSV